MFRWRSTTSEWGHRAPASLYSPPINLVERNQVFIHAGKQGQSSDEGIHSPTEVRVCDRKLCGRRGGSAKNEKLPV